MKWTKYLIDVNLKCESGTHLFANGLNGAVDIVHENDYLLISKYIANNTNIYEGMIPDNLWKKLIERQYLLDDDFDEESARSRMIKKVSEYSKKKITACRNVTFIFSYACNFACPYCYEQGVETGATMTV